MIRNKRIPYIIAFIVLLGAEIWIALKVHDTIIRPYVGDILVVAVIYCAVRCVIPNRCRLLPLWIFIFAAAVEGLQYLHLVQRLHLENNVFWRILIGSTFDWKDIACYAAGCVLLGIYEGVRLWYKKQNCLHFD